MRVGSATIRLVLVLLLGLAGLLAPLGTPARADDEAQPVAITIEGMEPALPDRNGTITLRGTATNNSGEPLSGVQAIFWRDQSPITDNSAFASTLASSPTQPWGSRVFDKVGAYQDLTTQQRLTIAPGESVPFQVQARVADLELPRTAGAYLIGVHVLGRVGRKANATIGRARLLVPLPREGSSAQPTPIPTVTAVLLSSRPAMIAPGLFADDHLSEELSAGGRLTLLLRAARRQNVSYLVDPSLLDEVTAMASAEGYQVQQSDGRTAPGGGSQVARRWLDEYSQLNVLEGFRLPYGTPDLSALAHQRMDAVLARTAAATDRPSRVRDLPLIAWSRDGTVAPDTLPVWEKTGASAILASNAQTSQALLKGPGQIPLVSYNPNLFNGGPGPDPRTTGVHLRQRLLAESYLDSLNKRGTPNVRVISTGAQASADLASDAPWVQRQSLRTLMDGRPAEWSGELAYPQSAAAAELSPLQGAALTDLQNSYAAYADLVVDPEPMNVRADAAVARAASSWWRGDQAGFETFTRPQLRQASALLTGSTITLNVQKSVIMSGQSGSFPITLVNGLNEAVHVTVEFDSDQPQRLSIPPQRNITIEPNRSVTVNIQPRAAGNGPVRVIAQLTTPNGTPLGRRTALSVEATNLGFVGWIIVVASGIVLLGATALRIRQVRRERQAAHRDQPAPEPDELTEHRTPKVIEIDPLPEEEVPSERHR
ncbi:hypothetical protein CGZ93_02080 [Enemella dayhoffiae]|uniref:Uncharacterized protein n=1 Tax=Enemella dayhoffiae TaxID=2016507 RepID=A0A255HFM1_9ACTN|nr:hypothetical protein CGZ93_02080 [Enemella dayhoffiae]